MHLHVFPTKRQGEAVDQNRLMLLVADELALGTSYNEPSRKPRTPNDQFLLIS